MAPAACPNLSIRLKGCDSDQCSTSARSETVVATAQEPPPWGTWISYEETVVKEGDYLDRNHGYNFEVSAMTDIGLCDPVPLKAMGRFNHEAVTVDPRTGIVHQTWLRARLSARVTTLCRYPKAFSVRGVGYSFHRDLSQHPAMPCGSTQVQSSTMTARRKLPLLIE